MEEQLYILSCMRPLVSMVQTCVVHPQGLKMGTPSDEAAEALEIKLSKRTVPCAHITACIQTFPTSERLSVRLTHCFGRVATLHTLCFFGRA